ncbi:hypothetical protein CDL12_19485 [Handroanthus impetiginosus]|uniref:F-box domain-containing protein n=1 Tax=Handroanthus impetiginosus TaxID=429701 RepID=A0A2G9GRP3_9LAMI|nr:hypothetical protein CDL12_19485 [Handroanthus impetiginosus]
MIATSSKKYLQANYRPRMERIHYLPEEIITDILSRLPVKSLLRFKSISQSWRSLISSQSFIKTHLETSTKNPAFAHHSMVSIIVNTRNNYELQHCSLRSFLFKAVIYASHSDFSIDISIRSVRLIGCCNGLVCILINRKDFFLWNPSTRESKKLPDIDSGMSSDQILQHGFGFDESGGSWTRMNNHLDDGYIVGTETGTFVSGNLHWTKTKKELNWQLYISSLDLKNEVYGIVEQPSILDYYFEVTLGVFDGCLWAFYHYLHHGYGDLWVLKQYGVKDS